METPQGLVMISGEDEDLPNLIYYAKLPSKVTIGWTSERIEAEAAKVRADKPLAARARSLFQVMQHTALIKNELLPFWGKPEFTKLQLSNHWRGMKGADFLEWVDLVREKEEVTKKIKEFRVDKAERPAYMMKHCDRALSVRRIIWARDINDWSTFDDADAKHEMESPYNGKR